LIFIAAFIASSDAAAFLRAFSSDCLCGNQSLVL